MSHVPIQFSKTLISNVSSNGKKAIMYRQVRRLQSGGRYISNSETLKIPQVYTTNYDKGGKALRPVSSNNATLNNRKAFSTNSICSMSDEKVPENNSATEETPEPLVLTERIKHLHIMTISMNRSKKRNCVNQEMAQEVEVNWKSGMVEDPKTFG